MFFNVWGKRDDKHANWMKMKEKLVEKPAFSSHTNKYLEEATNIIVPKISYWVIE